jgi:hypothetical protein
MASTTATTMRPRVLLSLAMPPQAAIAIVGARCYYLQTTAMTPASEAEGWWCQHSSSTLTDLGMDGELTLPQRINDSSTGLAAASPR